MNVDATNKAGPRWSDLAARPAGSVSLTALAGVDPAALGGSDLVDAIVAAKKAQSLLAGVQMRLLAAFAVPFVAGDPTRLAGRLARKTCITRDDDPTQVQVFLQEAASSLAAAEVAAALRISPVTAGIRVREATAMTEHLSPTREAFESGALDRGKVRVIVDHCRDLTVAHTLAVQHLVLPLAGTSTTGELRELTGQAVITVDPDGALERHHAAARRRDLSLTALPDAMATLTAFLPAPDAVKIFQISDLLATTSSGAHGDTRGIGARRVDALVDIADHLLTHGHLDLTDFLHPTSGDTPPGSATGHADTEPSGTTEPTGTSGDADETATLSATGKADAPAAGDATNQDAGTLDAGSPDPAVVPGSPADRSQRRRNNRVLTRQGRRPHLSVTIGLNTLAGFDDLPGRLQGFGAIPAELARTIAASAATITALVTDPTSGAVTSAGALTYRPRQHLRDAAAAVHQSCQFPSCRQPAWRCDLDHRGPFNHSNPHSGGQTTEENTGPLCRRHHLYKHHTEWRLRQDPRKSVLHWASPTGHSYPQHPKRTTPPQLWLTHTATTTVEHLDTITATATATATVNPATETANTAGSVIEELLTAQLLRHSINQPDIEYQDGEVPDSARSRHAEDECNDGEPPPF